MKIPEKGVCFAMNTFRPFLEQRKREKRLRKLLPTAKIVWKILPCACIVLKITCETRIRELNEATLLLARENRVLLTDEHWTLCYWYFCLCFFAQCSHSPAKVARTSCFLVWFYFKRFEPTIVSRFNMLTVFLINIFITLLDNS